LVVDPTKPTTLYAETANGLFKSTDGGEHWGKKLSCSIITYVKFDPITPATMYTACIYDSQYQSTDGGESWKKFENDKFLLIGDPLNPNIIYATGSGLFKSIDGGKNWQELKTGYANYFFINPINPDILYAGIGGVFSKSTDGGKNWQELKTGANRVGGFMMNPKNPDILYAQVWDDVRIAVIALIQSTDGGESWHKLNIDLPDTIVDLLAIDPSNPSILYLGTQGHGIFALIIAR
jgi:photosystem II stability/assembly factor-like uncharacterized protein